MDLESINKRSRHIKDVKRVSSELIDMAPEDIDARLENKTSIAAIRWENCHRAFVHLFMALNRGNGSKLPQDRFDIRLQHEEYDGQSFDTCVTVWRDREKRTYNVKPYIDCGSNIRDHSFATETFGRDYEYAYGTCYSQFAKVQMEYEGVMPEVRMTRHNGKLTGNLSQLDKAIFLAALEDTVMPGIEESENTLIMISHAMLDDSLNPELAEKVRLHYSVPRRVTEE